MGHKPQSPPSVGSAGVTTHQRQGASIPGQGAKPGGLVGAPPQPPPWSAIKNQSLVVSCSFPQLCPISSSITDRFSLN